MAELTLKDIAEKMRDIDICMMTTKTPSMALESRPMSNNRKVEYDGDSYFFAYDSCSAAQEIKQKPEVNLAFTHSPTLGKAFYLSVTGNAELIYDKAEMKKRWNKDVEIWFEDGLDTPGIVLIKVRAARLKYWQGTEEGEVSL